MGTSSKRNKLGKVDLNKLVINSVGVSGKGNINVLSALSLQELSCGLVGGEDRSSSAKLSAHVGDGSSLGNGKCLYALAAVLDDLAYAALNGKALEDFKDNVLCGYPGRKLACKLYLYYLGVCNIICAAAHCNRNVKSACADSDHTDTAACGGMAVGTDEGLAGSAESFKMYLVADTVAGTGEVNAMLLGNGADEAVVVRIFKA